MEKKFKDLVSDIEMDLEMPQSVLFSAKQTVFQPQDFSFE